MVIRVGLSQTRMMPNNLTMKMIMSKMKIRLASIIQSMTRNHCIQKMIKCLTAKLSHLIIVKIRLSHLNLIKIRMMTKVKRKSI